MAQEGHSPVLIFQSPVIILQSPVHYIRSLFKFCNSLPVLSLVPCLRVEHFSFHTAILTYRIAMNAIIRQLVREKKIRRSLVSERLASSEVETSDSATTEPSFLIAKSEPSVGANESYKE